MEDTQKQETQKQEKINFFKRVWYSITKIEKYPEMSSHGFGKAFGYLAIFVAIITLVLCIGTFYKMGDFINNTENMQNVLSEFSDSEEELKAEAQKAIEQIEASSTTEKILMYSGAMLVVFICTFGILLVMILINVLYISLVGYVTSKFAGIKMRYVAIFNMSVYSLTLSLILLIAYVGINMFTSFYIKYFQFMYDAVAIIYIVSAILILKSEIIKKQVELMKIKQVQQIIKEQLENEKQKDKERKEKEERKKKDKEEQSGDEGATGESCCFEERKDI